jgi:hypothetical protein
MKNDNGHYTLLINKLVNVSNIIIVRIFYQKTF